MSAPVERQRSAAEEPEATAQDTLLAAPPHDEEGKLEGKEEVETVETAKAAQAETVKASGRQTANVAQTYVTFFKSFVGIAILGLPHAFSLAGYVLAPLGFLVICYTSFYCMRLLLACKYRLLESEGATFDCVDGVQYPDVARACLGKRGQRLTEFCLITSQMGFTVGYLIFIGESTPSAVSALGGPELSLTGCVVVSAVALVPLVWLRTIEKLASSALLANVAILFGIVTVVAYDVKVGLQPNHGDRGLVAANWAGVPLYWGSAVFAMEGIALVLPVEHAMTDKTKFPAVLRNSCVALTLLLGGFASVCYVTFGDETEDLITMNLPPSDRAVVVMQLLYCVSLFFTFPLMLFPCLVRHLAQSTYSPSSAHVSCLWE
jgi:proton-coupled amino acid transporter